MNGYGYQTRRRWLGTCASVVSTSVLAGCSGSDDNGNGGGNETEQTSERIVDQDWPMYGVDLQNTAYQPNVRGPEGNEVNAREVYDMNGGSSYPVVIADDHLYATSRDGVVIALDRETEEFLWEADGHGSLMVLGDTIYGPRGSHSVYGYERENGDRWESNEIDLENSLNLNNDPIATEDGVFVISDHNVWRIDPDSREYSSVRDYPRDSWDLIGTTDIPAYDDGVLYHAMGIELYALDVESGEHKWTAEGESVLHISNPVVADSMVYVSGGDDLLHAFDTETGEKVWVESINTSIEESPAIAEGLIYLSGNQRVLAIDCETGTLEWEEDEKYGTSEIVVAGNSVLIADTFGIRSYDRSSGILEWEYEIKDPTEDGLSSPPSVSDGLVYCQSTNGYLYAIGDN